jgi:hypothetical protein
MEMMRMQATMCSYLTTEPTEPEALYQNLLQSGALETQRLYILQILSDGNWHSTEEICDVANAHQYNARISEIRDAVNAVVGPNKQQWDIVAERFEGIHGFRLKLVPLGFTTKELRKMVKK